MSSPDLAFVCPNCKDKDNIDFEADNYVSCIKCKWMFSFKKCKTVNAGDELFKHRDD